MNLEHGRKSRNYIDDITLTLIESDDCGITMLPHSEGFETYSSATANGATGDEPTCWNLAHQYVVVASSTKPQICKGPAYASSGNFALMLKSQCVYAMPELKVENVNVSDLQMELYVKQPYAKNQLEVGVLENLNGDASFTPVATINNDGTGITQQFIDFSSYTGTGKIIAFRNSNSDGSTDYAYNFIDDINIFIANSQNDCGITMLPHNEGFETYSQATVNGATGDEPTCWNRPYPREAIAAVPQICKGPAYASSGNFALMLKSQCVYAMPELKIDNISVSDLQMELYAILIRWPRQSNIHLLQEKVLKSMCMESFLKLLLHILPNMVIFLTTFRQMAKLLATNWKHTEAKA